MTHRTRILQPRPLGALDGCGIVTTAAVARSSDMIVARTRSGRTIAQPEQRKTAQSASVDGALADLPRDELVNARRWNDAAAWPVIVLLEGELS